MTDERLRKALEAAEKMTAGGSVIINSADLNEAENAGLVEHQPDGRYTLTPKGKLRLAEFRQ